jgi:hypothetical protein
MKRRGLVLLAIVAAAMAAYLLFDARHRPGGGERATARERALAPFDRKKVRAITIRRQRGEGVSLLPSSAPPPAPAWHLEAESEPPADDAAIDDLLAAVDLAESDRTADITPEAAGLAPAVAEIDIETPNGTLILQLGRADATGQGVYARAGLDGRIRVVGRRVLEVVDREPSAFRDRRLFPVDPAGVMSLAWRGEGVSGELRLVDGRWQNGRKQWVADERVAESLRRLLALRVERFQPVPHDRPYAPRTLALTAGPARIALEIEKGGTGAMTRGSERVHVPADAFESAWRSLAAAAARDDRLLALPPDKVTRIDLHDDHGRVGLRRVDGSWAFSTPKLPYAPDTRVVDDWLARLAAVKAATRADGAKARHLIVEGRFRQQIDVSAPPDAYALLAPDPLRFRERVVLSFARFDLKRLARAAGTDTQTVTTDSGGNWQTSSGATVDAENVGRVIGALSELRATEFVAAPPPGQPALRLEVDVQPPGEARPARHVVELWQRKQGGCVARLDADAAFTAEPATCANLRQELLVER